MTLRQVLNNNMGNVVKVGADTGFIYCDTVTEETIEIIDEIAAKTRSKRSSELRWKENRLKTFDAWWKGEREKQMNAFRKQKEDDKYLAKKNKTKPLITKTIKQFSKELTQQKLARKENLKNFVAYETKYLGNWIRYTSREVKKTYDSVDEDALIIIFEGDEAGKYWTSKEYREANKKEEIAA